MTTMTGRGTVNASGRASQRLLLLVIASVFVLKAIVTLWMLVGQSDAHTADFTIGWTDNYQLIAHNIISGNGYRFTPQTAPTTLREPGYPLLLAGLSAVFGNALWIVVLANLVMSSISALLIGLLARQIFTDRLVPLVAPILFMLHPGEIVAELRSGVEVPFTLLLLCFFVLWRRALVSEKPTAYFLSGLALGLACTVRSAVLLFPLFLLLYQMVRTRGQAALLFRRICGVALMTFALGLVLTPWTVRNSSLVHEFIPTASVQGHSMQVGLYQCTHGGVGQDFAQMEQAASEDRKRQALAAGYRFEGDYYLYFYDPKDEVRFNALLKQQVVDTYKQSPALLLKCASENVANFWFRGRTTFATIGITLVQVPWLVLAFLGLVMGFRRSERATLVSILLFVVYLVAVCAPIHAEARYSVPLIPFLAILAAIPICRWIEYLRGRGAGINRRPTRTAAVPRIPLTVPTRGVT
jgi:4-amino-4-deoxy-L-arabinose transferase-like glycosyltransferase